MKIRFSRFQILPAALLLLVAWTGAASARELHVSNGKDVVAMDVTGPWQHFKKPSDAVLKKHLSRLAYNVTQEEGTEPAFHNAYWDNHEAGIYVDVVSGEPLFSSLDKFDSGTGWPSFTRPLVDEYVVQRGDDSLGMSRTEVRSKFAGSHLGHVFDDGPAPTGRRYCIDSAALRFIPADSLEAEGYGAFAPLFERNTSPDNPREAKTP